MDIDKLFQDEQNNNANELFALYDDNEKLIRYFKSIDEKVKNVIKSANAERINMTSKKISQALHLLSSLKFEIFIFDVDIPDTYEKKWEKNLHYIIDEMTISEIDIFLDKTISLKKEIIIAIKKLEEEKIEKEEVEHLRKLKEDEKKKDEIKQKLEEKERKKEEAKIKHKTVKIGEQVWLAENLNLDVGKGCWCYDNDKGNCQKFGRLYTWDAARRAADKILGWHLPTYAEWKQLEDCLGSSSYVGAKLKANNVWEDRNNSSGFSALMGGNRLSDGNFINMGKYASFWTATTNDSRHVWCRSLSYSDSSVNRRGCCEIDLGLSVRLVRD